MGSESSPHVLFQAVSRLSNELSGEDSFVIYLTEEVVRDLFDGISPDTLPRIDLHLVSETIEMEDDPLSSIRLKKDSSLVVGVRQLKEKKIDAFVSAGNTGALMTASAIHLPLSQIGRPALLAILPTLSGSLAMVDVGGMVTSKAHHLVQYAHLGAAFQRCRTGSSKPKVGLLNIGIESKKGTPEVREAYRILTEESRQETSRFTFIGNIEGREIFEKEIDVLVTDGFTGNVMLKTSEGIASFIFQYLLQALREEATENIQEILTSLKRHFNYEEYPGAIICGIDGIVVKCHGAATEKAMQQSIRSALSLSKQGLLDKIKEEF